MARSSVNGDGDCTMSESLVVIDEISRQFFEMVPARRMKWKDNEAEKLVSCLELQRKLLNATVLHPLCSQFPPSIAYRKYFMKILLNKLESSGGDICDEIYEAYAELVAAHDGEDNVCFKSYSLPKNERITIKESTNLVSNGTTGLSTWQAAQHLSEWLLENPQLVSGKTVLELGSGQGLTGMVACKCCQVKGYTFTDCHPQVLQLLSQNIETNLTNSSDSNCNSSSSSSSSNEESNNLQQKLNNSTSNQQENNRNSPSFNTSENNIDCNNTVRTSTSQSNQQRVNSSSKSKRELAIEQGLDEIVLDRVELEVDSNSWKNEGGSKRSASFKPDPRVCLCYLDWECLKERYLDRLRADVILGADVVYDSRITPALVYVLKRFLEKGPDGKSKPKAYIASTIRNEDTRDDFLIAIGSEGLSYCIVEPPKKQIFHYDTSVPIEILQLWLDE